MVQPWVTATDLVGSTHPDADYAIEIATWILFKLTAEKYPGSSTDTETYRTTDTGLMCQWMVGDVAQKVLPVAPMHKELALYHTPVTAITYVKEGGDALGMNDLRFTRHRTLAKRNGTPWNFTDGVTVRYTHGMNPPTAGKLAAARLADQFILSFCGSDECRLPDRVTSVSRQGTSYTILDPQEFMQDGRTGLYEVDLFITAANPNRAKMKPRVYSPDAPRYTRS